MSMNIWKAKNKLKLMILPFFILILLTAGLFNQNVVQAEEEIALRVIGAEAVVDTIEDTNSFNAVFQAQNEYSVIPRLQGELEDIKVEVGDTVEQGQVLAEIDDERYQIELEQAEAQLEAAQAEFERLKKGATEEELDQVRAQVEEARISVEGAQNEVGYSEKIYEERTPDDMEIEQMKNELEQAEIQLEMAEKEYQQAKLAYEEAEDNYQRMARLFDEGAISEQQYQEVKTGRDQAANQLEMAEDGIRQAEAALEGAEVIYEMRLDLYDFRVEEERMVDQAKTQYQAAQAALEGAEAMLAEAERGPTEEEIKAVEAQVKQARSGLELAKTTYEDIEIQAPADGIVAQIQQEVGEMASPEAPLFYILNLDQMKATANVNEPYISDISVGDEAQVKVNGLPGEEFVGRISSIPPMVGEQGGFPVEVRVSNPEHRIKAGMRGSVELTVAQSEETVLIPQGAIFTPDGSEQEAVYVVEDGRARKQTVVTGIETVDLIEIESGLAEGDQVVLYDHYRLEDGQRVEVVEYETF